MCEHPESSTIPRQTGPSGAAGLCRFLTMPIPSPSPAASLASPSQAGKSSYRHLPEHPGTRQGGPSDTLGLRGFEVSSVWHEELKHKAYVFLYQKRTKSETSDQPAEHNHSR